MITRLSSLVLLAVVFLSCNPKGTSQSNEFGIFGDSTITEDGAILASELPSKLKGLDSIQVKLRGNIDAVCQAKGCWMNMPISENENLTVKFKDYAFFVPKNSSGREAIIDGIAFVDTIGVTELQHLAKDAEKSDEEIAKITEPEVKYIFQASGVIIK